MSLVHKVRHDSPPTRSPPQRDGPDGGGGLNCGVTYWQNLDPSGPMVWMVVTLIERLYR